MSQPTPFDDIAIRDWMVTSVEPPRSFPRRLSSLGSGPFEEIQFSGFLYWIGVEVLQPDSDSEIVVVGREEWTELELQGIIRGRVGSTIRVYSQEMLIAWILAGADPFDEGEDLLLRLAGDHPALKYLMSFGFDWPKTEVVGGGGSEVRLEVPTVGILAHMGYRVGKTAGRSRRKRQRVLKRVFWEEDLPFVKDRAYMQQWGEAASRKRLRKMADTIASLCRNEKRRNEQLGGSLDEAISQREEDLAWLKRDLYDGNFNFSWPSTHL